MEQSVFEARDYKAYLSALAEARPRGFRKSLAEATGCQTAYITHVLNSSGHFSLEQAEAASRFLGFTREETRYWLALVEYNRAGTPTLRRVLSEQLTELRERHLLLRKKVGIQATLSRENQAIYYGSWHYAAVHMAITVPALQSRAALARSLRVPPRKLAQVLEFLISVGLVVQQGDRLTTGKTLLHLEKDSPSIFKHHANWRIRALDALHDDSGEEAVHYSSVVTLSAEDAQKLRALISRHLGEWIHLVKDSREERVYGLGLDFFRVDAD